MLLPLFLWWLMLLPLVADGMPLDFFYVVDVITTWFSLADVIAKLCDVADVIATWQMLLPLGWRFGRCYSQCGRCYSHLGLYYFNLSSVMLFRTSSHT